MINEAHVIVIAEAGVNHNGDIALAEDMVAAAAEAGADYVKFQTYNTGRLVHTAAPKANYQIRGTEALETQYQMLERLELTPEAHQILFHTSQRRGIGFLSTAFDEDSAEFLRKFNMDYYKVPSGEITNVPLLRRIGALGRRVILSTGMSTIGEVDSAICWLCEGGIRREDISLLHCTSQYPAHWKQVNLKAMLSLKSAFGLPVGYSDHTIGIEVAVAAVALGAVIIEKHFTLDRNLPGPDHAASLEPEELRTLVRSIRNVELAMGSGVKRPVEGEAEVARVARKGIFTKVAVSAGDRFTAENLCTMRPVMGRGAEMWDSIVGTTATRSYLAGEPVLPT
ncbi:MAG: N-acetylneuraminate synthase [Spirochaetales bacterium]|nr:N-acetylneuraminate synthase [Spirochaetales bacterium]